MLLAACCLAPSDPSPSSVAAPVSTSAQLRDATGAWRSVVARAPWPQPGPAARLRAPSQRVAVDRVSVRTRGAALLLCHAAYRARGLQATERMTWSDTTRCKSRDRGSDMLTDTTMTSKAQKNRRWMHNRNWSE